MQVLRKAEPTKSNTWFQEGRSDSRIQTHTLRYFSDIRPRHLAQIGNHVDERNLHGEKRIGCVFDELCRICVSYEKRRHFSFRTGVVNRTSKGLIYDRRIDLLHQPCSTRRTDSYDNPVRMKKIMNRGAFPQKLGIGHYVVL